MRRAISIATWTDFLQISMLATRHQAYAVTRAVLHVFRDHLTISDALMFAEVLPAVLRAIFVENWRPADSPPLFPDRQTLVQEVKANRRDHNLASESSIRDVAAALRRNVDNASLDRALSRLPAGAADYWAV